MSYITLPQLAEMPGALELAQIAGDKQDLPVSAELMDATLRDGDRSGYPAEEIAKADDAARRITAAITETGGVIDGYLARRYTLPLSRSSALLVTWARAIVRYRLHGDRISGESNDPVVRDYRDAIKFLEQVADGRFSLGAMDPAAQGSGMGDIAMSPGSKVFGREYLP